ncbi:MAG: excinuclease ABC subunit C, partial [Planctomycetes bacterium]|nr:excinuclease ABC subunit C [Planctomycetota bacterium]
EEHGAAPTQRSFERVWRLDAEAAVIFPPASLECLLLVRIRDAAHRAAIRFHRETRRKAALRSGLEEVPGVGPKRRLALLRRFGSLKSIRAASQAELEEILPVKVAGAVREHLDLAKTSLGDDAPAEPEGGSPASSGAPEGPDSGSDVL